MAVTPLTTDLNHVQALDDRPNANSGFTADQVKEVFDQSGNDIKTYINDVMIPSLDSTFETKTAITTDRKLSPTGDFTGTINGLPIINSNPGLATEFAALQADVMQRGVNYLMFRNAYIDDGAMIKAAHDYANAHNLPIVNPSGEYYINSIRDIEVKTSTDLGKSIFHINDKYLNSPVFNMKGSYSEVTLANTGGLYTAVLPYLVKGATPIISQLASYRNSIVEFYDSGNLVYARSGSNATSGSAMYDQCYINDKGKIEGEITWTFTGLTSIVVKQLDENYVDFKGGGFLMSGDSDDSIEVLSGMYRRGIIVCSRSRVRIKEQFFGFDVGKTDLNKYGSEGLIKLGSCYDVTIESVKGVALVDVSLNGVIAPTNSTYGLRFDKVSKLNLRNIYANGTNESWGVVGANDIKDVIVDNCKLNRFDTHQHLWNLHIKDTTIGTKGITIIGGGKLVIEDTVSEASGFIVFRNDYGATWDGDVTLKRCMLKPTSDTTTSNSPLIFFHSTGDYNYKVDIVHCRNIYVEDFVFDYSNLTNLHREPIFYFSSLDANNLTNIGAGRYQLPDSMTFKRVKKRRGATSVVPRNMIYVKYLPLALVTKAGSYGTGIAGDGFKTNCNIVIDDCDTNDYTKILTTDEESVISFPANVAATYVSNTPYYDIKIISCKGVKIKVGGYPVYLRITDSDICAIDFTSDGDVASTAILAFALLTRCLLLIDGTTAAYTSSAKTAFYLRQGTNVRLINCHLVNPLVNGVAASNSQLTRVFGNSIVDFVTSKILKCTMSGTTIDQSLVTAQSVTDAQRQKIFLGSIYLAAGYAY